MASSTLAATCSGPTVPNGFSPVLIMPGITTLTPTGASIAASSARNPSEIPSTPCFDAV